MKHLLFGSYLAGRNENRGPVDSTLLEQAESTPNDPPAWVQAGAGLIAALALMAVGLWWLGA